MNLNSQCKPLNVYSVNLYPLTLIPLQQHSTYYFTTFNMLPIQYPNNSQYMRYEYHRVREGPNYFVSYYKNTSRLHYDPKDTWRTLGTAKFTDTGKDLKDWCLQMYEEYSVPQLKKWSSSAVEEFRGSGRKDTSFASEAMEEDLSPSEETKMIT